MTEPFSCPTCGAPLTYHEGDDPTILCPFCRSSVIVPPELHHHQAQVETPSPPKPSEEPKAWLDTLVLPRIRELLARNQKIEAIKVLRQNTYLGLREAKEVVEEVEKGERNSLVSLSIKGPYLPSDDLSNPLKPPTVKTSSPVRNILTVVFFLLIAAGIYLALLKPPPAPPPPTPTAPPTPTPVPTPSPTPPFAFPISSLGSQGIGAGKFSQANSLALDSDGYLYVGDYEGNRVQVFDQTGKFIVQWNLDPELHILRLAAGLNGELYANQSGRIFRYDRRTGQQTGEVVYTDPADADTDNFDTMAVALDGSLVTAWINHTLETSTFLRFDSSGKLLQTIPNPIQEQTGEWENRIYLAIDGLGNIFGLGEHNNTVCVYSPEGKLVSRFGSEGSKPGQFDSVESIAIDSLGRVYIGEYTQVSVFDSSGLYLDSFPVDRGAYVMIFDRQDNLFLLGTQQVNKYNLRRQ